MPRYMVERTFPGGLQIPVNDEGAQARRPAWAWSTRTANSG
jgi:hypothetical protein